MLTSAPFASAFAPWLERAERDLRAGDPHLEATVSEGAIAELLDGLARELGEIVAPTLVERFLHHPGRAFFDPTSTGAYHRFCEELARGAMGRILSELSELERVLDAAVEDWCGRTGAFVERLCHDAPDLAEAFGSCLPAGSAVPLADSAVAIGRQPGQVAVVYKSRSLGMDVAFAEMVRWVNATGARVDLRVPSVIDRGDHGWMEHVAQRPPSDADERADHLRRIGMLLALVHLLGGGDVHAGNVRVDGGHPVIIDAEVLLRPHPSGQSARTSTVTTTGWLPTVYESERCGLAWEHYDDRPSRWVHAGTDAMRRRPLRSPLAAMRPEVRGLFARDPTGTGDLLVDGFRRVYGVALEHGLPLELFVSARPRVLLRTSHLYQETIEHSLEPDALSSSADRRAVFDRLVGDPPPVLVATTASPTLIQACAAAERRAMSELRVPRFVIPADSRELGWEGEVIGMLDTMTPLERARSIVADACSERLEEHCETIRQVIAEAAHLDENRPPLRIEIDPRPAAPSLDVQVRPVDT